MVLSVASLVVHLLRKIMPVVTRSISVHNTNQLILGNVLEYLFHSCYCSRNPIINISMYFYSLLSGCSGTDSINSTEKGRPPRIKSLGSALCFMLELFCEKWESLQIHALLRQKSVSQIPKSFHLYIKSKPGGPEIECYFEPWGGEERLWHKESFHTAANRKFVQVREVELRREWEEGNNSWYVLVPSSEFRPLGEGRNVEVRKWKVVNTSQRTWGGLHIEGPGLPLHVQNPKGLTSCGATGWGGAAPQRRKGHMC